MRGRRPVGPEVVERLQGSEQAKKRLRVILETLMGQRRVQEACRELGIGEVRFNQLRLEALEAARAALENKPKGRPRREALPVSMAEVEELSHRVEGLRQQLETSQIREEILLTGVGGRAEPAGVAEKKTPPRTARRKRRRRSAPI
jgi:hypothetical protein